MNKYICDCCEKRVVEFSVGEWIVSSLCVYLVIGYLMITLFRWVF
jgi:hypothetical protein